MRRRHPYRGNLHPPHTVHHAQTPAQPQHTLTGDELNDLAEQSHGNQAMFKQLVDQRLHGNTVALGNPAPASLRVQQAQIGNQDISYTFTVGDDKIPHLYQAHRNPDGSVSGQTYVVNSRGEKTPANLSPAQENALRGFAGEDMTAGVTGQHKLSPGQINRVANAEARAILTFAQEAQKAATVTDALSVIRRNQDSVQDFLHNHPERAREMLAPDSPYNKAAALFMAQYPQNSLSADFRRFGVEPAKDTPNPAAPRNT